MKIVNQSAELLWITPNAEQMIEKSGRICYKSESSVNSESASKFINSLIDRHHEAVLEHASASLLFVTDRGVSHELVRHRLASYCQESTRYCNYSKDKFNNEITVIKPSSAKIKIINCDGHTPQEEVSEDKATLFWYCSMLNAELNYLAALREGWTAQEARSILPTCLKTEIVCTANMREWRTIFKLRLDKAAHPQMRELMKLAYNILVKEVPSVFADIKGE